MCVYKLRELGHCSKVVITNADGMPLRPHPLAVAAFKDFLVVSSRPLAILEVRDAFFAALPGPGPQDATLPKSEATIRNPWQFSL